MFPDKKILRMDNDTTQNKDAVVKILDDFAKKRASILVGTQMIAKGHDFPEVTLVGIVDADMSLHFADYRSAERTYQLITQVSGRAGRNEKEGQVVLQTYSPSHYVYRFAVKNDYHGFFNKECNLREVTNFPPFTRIIRVLVTSTIEELTRDVLKGIFTDLSEFIKDKPSDVVYFSPMWSPVKRIQAKYRMQILMRVKNDVRAFTRGVYEIVDKHLTPKVSVFVELNPNNLN
jgi:primosomal protein N' (replication factor Y)